VKARWLRALILVVVLVGGVITPVAPVGDARATPSGFVTIPDANVHEDLPVDQSLPISKEDLEGSVMVSDNASTTEVIVTNGKRAEGYLDNGSRVGSGELALVIQDDTNHEGREVAIPADAVKGAIGRIPEAVHGTHEDGSEWTSQVRAQSGLLIFEVPRFSSNTVAFSGTVVVNGTYTDGSSVSYDINSVDSVSNMSINVTGVETTETDTFSLGNGESTSSTIAGSQIPSSATVDVSWPDQTVSKSVDWVAYDGGTKSWTYSDTPAEFHTLTVKAEQMTESSESLDITVEDGSGTQIASDTISYNGTTNPIEDVSIPGDPGEITITATASGPSVGIYEFDLKGKTPEPVDVTVDGTTKSWSSQGSKTISLDSDSGVDVSVSGSNSASLTASVSYTETSVTTDPAISVNSHTTSYSGTIAEGSTKSLSVNESWVQSGTNTVNVSVGTVSSDAPTPAVGLDYQHKASDEISVSYSSDGWTERYNTSHTFVSTQENPTFSVPFQGTVTEITRLEERIDGGSWSQVPSSRYTLDDSTLTVQLDDGDGDGDVDAGTNISVRATGRHVVPVNGGITVTDPILPGEDQDVEFRIDSKSSGFYIDLSNVPNAGVRYTYQESWSNPESHMIVTADGEKRLKLPNAPEGGSARVTLAPLTVTPETGDAKVSVADPDEPTITMGAGSSSGDDVTITYLDASTGTTYQLYSTSRDRIVAKEEADAGTVSFVEDDSAESLMINTTSSGGGGGGLGFEANTAADYGVERPVLVMGALAALVVGLVWATGRTGLRGRSRWGLVGAVSLALGLISLESLYPGAISQRIGEGIGTVFSQIGTVVPIAGIGAVAIVGYTVVSWWRSRQKEASTPETKVNFTLSDDNK